MIDLRINKEGLKHNIQKAKENHIIIPTHHRADAESGSHPRKSRKS